MVAVLEDFTRCSLRRGILYMHTAIAIATALGLRDRHMFPLPHFHINASSTIKHACGVVSEPVDFQGSWSIVLMVQDC
jgi:hypothetical protein